MDSLTGLHSLYDLDEYLNEDIHRALFIDIDNFQMVMYIYGHEVGDRYLVRIAGFLKEIAKKYKLKVFRVAGEKFLILYSSKADSYQEFISNSIKQLELECEYRDGYGSVLTISSVEFDCSKSESGTFKSTIEELKDKVWEAKQQGKKRDVHICS